MQMLQENDVQNNPSSEENWVAQKSVLPRFVFFSNRLPNTVQKDCTANPHQTAIPFAATCLWTC
jgi:hypothetical protein